MVLQGLETFNACDGIPWVEEFKDPTNEGLEQDAAEHGDHVCKAHGDPASLIGEDTVNKGKGDAFWGKEDAKEEEAGEEKQMVVMLLHGMISK